MNMLGAPVGDTVFAEAFARPKQKIPSLPIHQIAHHSEHAPNRNYAPQKVSMLKKS